MDKKNFGFIDRGKVELQELVPKSEPKKLRVDPIGRMTTMKLLRP